MTPEDKMLNLLGLALRASKKMKQSLCFVRQTAARTPKKN